MTDKIPTDAQQYLNVASQCAATATSELAKNVLVDDGSGTLRELLNDAADAIRAGWAIKQGQPMTDKPSPTDPELNTPSDAEIIMLDVESGISVRAGKGAVMLAGASKEASMARSDDALNAGPRVQHKHTVLSALAAAQKPMTASQIDEVVGIGVSEVRKAIRKLAAAEVVHLYAWSRENAARAWAPVWAYGQGEHAPAPNGAKPVKAQLAKPKPDSPPEQMARTAHLAIPVTGFRTTFVGGINPWGLVT